MKDLRDMTIEELEELKENIEKEQDKRNDQLARCEDAEYNLIAIFEELEDNDIRVFIDKGIASGLHSASDFYFSHCGDTIKIQPSKAYLDRKKRLSDFERNFTPV